MEKTANKKDPVTKGLDLDFGVLKKDFSRSYALDSRSDRPQNQANQRALNPDPPLTSTNALASIDDAMSSVENAFKQLASVRALLEAQTEDEINNCETHYEEVKDECPHN